MKLIITTLIFSTMFLWNFFHFQSKTAELQYLMEKPTEQVSNYTIKRIIKDVEILKDKFNTLEAEQIKISSTTKDLSNEVFGFDDYIN